MNIEAILVGVLLFVFFSDFLMKALRKKPSSNITEISKNRTVNHNKKYSHLLLTIFLGPFIGYFIDWLLNSNSIHEILFSQETLNGCKYCEPIKQTDANNFLAFGFGFFIVFLLALIFKPNLTLFKPNPTRIPVITYFFSRPKNSVLFILLSLFLKVTLHYSLFPSIDFGRYSSRKFSLGEHFELMFVEEIWLYIPSILILSFIAWFFNDKIKAR
jgi:hypothetical protein